MLDIDPEANPFLYRLNNPLINEPRVSTLHSKDYQQPHTCDPTFTLGLVLAGVASWHQATEEKIIAQTSKKLSVVK